LQTRKKKLKNRINKKEGGKSGRSRGGLVNAVFEAEEKVKTLGD